MMSKYNSRYQGLPFCHSNHIIHNCLSLLGFITFAYTVAFGLSGNLQIYSTGRLGTNIVYPDLFYPYPTLASVGQKVFSHMYILPFKFSIRQGFTVVRFAFELRKVKLRSSFDRTSHRNK